MIASFTHNLIFVKTRKTAGTSVEIVLSTWCSDEDICTPILPEDELIRADYGAEPRNFSADKSFESAYIAAQRARDVEKMRYLRKLVRKPDFYNHMPAAEIQAKLPDLWNRAFKFTVERHPFEKIVSRAYYRRSLSGKDSPITKWIDRVLDEEPVTDRHIYMDGDEPVVDKVIAFDSLWKTLAEIGEKIGKKLPDPLPRAKGTARDDRRAARYILTKPQRQRINDMFEREFELLSIREPF